MKLRTLFFGLVAALGLAGTANAAYVPATWTDTYDVGTGIYLGPGESYSYWHDITFDGFNVGTDFVDDFLLTINLFDDKDSLWESLEFGFVDLPGVLGDVFVWDFSHDTVAGVSVLGLLELNVYGTLSVTIQSVCDPFFGVVCGDFYFGGSQLVASGYTPGAATSVPTPGTLGLFGIGLLGIAMAARRRRTNV